MRSSAGLIPLRPPANRGRGLYAIRGVVNGASAEMIWIIRAIHIISRVLLLQTNRFISRSAEAFRHRLSRVRAWCAVQADQSANRGAVVGAVRLRSHRRGCAFRGGKGRYRFSHRHRSEFHATCRASREPQAAEDFGLGLREQLAVGSGESERCKGTGYLIR